MRISIVESQYLSIYINEDQKLFEQFWYAESEHMSDEDYRSLHLAWVQKMIQNKYDLQYFYLDNRANFFVISKTLQQWHAQQVYAPVLAHLPNPNTVKTAIVVSQDFLSQLSIERTVKTKEEINQITYYFTNPHEAQNWLLKSD